MKKIKSLLTSMPMVAMLVFGFATATLASTVVETGVVHAFDKSMGDGASSARGKDMPEEELFEEGGGGIFQTITNVLLFIIGAISVIMLIVGGIRYVVSGGDQNAVTSAKNTILYAIVGIIVALLAYAVVNFIIGSFAAGN